MFIYYMSKIEEYTLILKAVKSNLDSLETIYIEKSRLKDSLLEKLPNKKLSLALKKRNKKLSKKKLPLELINKNKVYGKYCKLQEYQDHLQD